MKIVKLIYLAPMLAANLLFSCTGQQSRVNFKELSQKPNTVIIDVRTIEEFNDDGHIEQSINIPLQVLPDSAQNLKRFDNIILVCRSGKRSEQAKAILDESGLKNIYDGGGWESLSEKLK